MGTNRAARRYIRLVKSWIPCAGKMKKQIMVQISNRVQECLESQPAISYDDLCAKFGTPQEIAATYTDNTETAEILKNLRIRKRIVTTVIATVLVILVTWAVMVTIETIEIRNSKGAGGIEEIEIMEETVIEE